MFSILTQEQKDQLKQLKDNPIIAEYARKS